VTPVLRKLVLTAHVALSVGMLGAVLVFLALAGVGLASQDLPLVRAAYITNGLIARDIILPLLLTSLAIGLFQALTTPWGLFRHYWVIAKLLLTVFTLYVLLRQLDGIGYMADMARTAAFSTADLQGLRHSFRLHAAGGLAVLFLITVLSVHKPQGLTRYGWRTLHEKRTGAS
jgi:hypothetical protein